MTDARTLIAVRGRDPRVAGFVDTLRAGHRVLALEGPRGIDPRRFGLPSAGADWYLDVEGAPDPTGFGLGLAHLERVLLEQEPGVWLLGDGQGAALALALACCRAERLAALIAIDGALPELPAGAIAEVPLAELPVLLVGDCGESAARLAARGARVEVDPRPVPEALERAVRWLADRARERRGLRA